jgi:hypothetical protein
VNGKLGRLVLDHVTDRPEDLDMAVWAVESPCGTSACVGGWALILSGEWELVADNAFRRTDRRLVITTPADIGEEARRLLALSLDEFWREDPAGDVTCLFSVSDLEAVEWLRELVEKAEAIHA